MKQIGPIFILASLSRMLVNEHLWSWGWAEYFLFLQLMLMTIARHALRRTSRAAFLFSCLLSCKNSNRYANRGSGFKVWFTAGSPAVLGFELAAYWSLAQDKSCCINSISTQTYANPTDNRMDSNRRWEWNSSRISPQEFVVFLLLGEKNELSLKRY